MALRRRSTALRILALVRQFPGYLRPSSSFAKAGRDRSCMHVARRRAWYLFSSRSNVSSASPTRSPTSWPMPKSPRRLFHRGRFRPPGQVLCRSGTDIGHFVAEKVQPIPGINETRTIVTFKAFSKMAPPPIHTAAGVSSFLRRRLRALPRRQREDIVRNRGAVDSAEQRRVADDFGHRAAGKIAGWRHAVAEEARDIFFRPDLSAPCPGRPA